MMTSRAATLLLVLGSFFGAACNGDVYSGEGEGEGAGEGEGEGEGEGAVGEGEGEGAVNRTFPCGTGGTIGSDDSCAADADCIAVTIQINCCGTQSVTGVNADSAAQFNDVVTQCDAGWPACGCAEQAPTADDGSTGDFQHSATVACDNGVCITRFLP